MSPLADTFEHATSDPRLELHMFLADILDPQFLIVQEPVGQYVSWSNQQVLHG